MDTRKHLLLEQIGIGALNNRYGLQIVSVAKLGLIWSP